MKYHYIGSNDGYIINDDEIVCEVCGDVCTNDFVLFEFPTEYQDYYVCRDCNRELTERYQIELDRIADEMSEQF